MLIRVPRLTVADLATWATHERTDAVNAERWRSKLETMAAQATEAIAAWHRDGPGYAGVSWGKDSVVVAHLIVRAGLDVPLVWVRVDGVENPYSPLVRDAFLARWPVRYEEIEAPAGAHRTSAEGFRIAAERFGDRYVSGVRAEESRARRVSLATHGIDTGRACRPIARWSTAQVFAYSQAHGLPLHPAYAMTMGGMLPREHLRVAALGGERGRGHGREEWERRYYGP